MRRFVRVAMALASVAMVAPALAGAQAKPVVGVLYFENNSIGKDARDFDGIGKGMAELLINDLLASPNLRVVERERIQALITEQNLVKSGAIDPQTAIRLGKIIGAQYMITGQFMNTPMGVVLSARTINVETSAIGNPTRVDAKGDDVLDMVGKLNAKLIAEMKLPALRTGDAGSTGGATPAGQPAAAPAQETKVAETKPAEAKQSDTKVAARPARSARKMDMKTAMLYSKALEEEDAGNKSKSLELYRQVNDKFPNYAPVTKKIDRLSRG